MSIAGATVDLVTGSAPDPSGGPTIAATGNQTVVNGGTSEVTISSDTPFSTVYVFVGGKSVGLIAEGSGSIRGYYAVRLPDPVTSVVLLLSFPQSLPSNEFQGSFAVEDPEGRVGAAPGFTYFVTQVGTGDVQVTLSWDTVADVDLHVIDPSGEEIFYGNRLSASGGKLDLDSNAACGGNDVRNENITWPVGMAPSGTYTVRVDYWSNCDVVRTNYTVRINVGGSTQVFRGTFTGPGDQGGVGSGVFISTFERTTGPAAVVSGSRTSDRAFGTKTLAGTTGR